jgi:hypothetical protein
MRASVAMRGFAVMVALTASLDACGAASGREPAESSDPSGSASSDPADFIAPEEACDGDDDCVITDFSGCCDCCGCAYPYAIRADALAAGRARCETFDCTEEWAEQECAIVQCEGCPVTDERFRAVCSSGRCTPEPA